MSKKGQKGKLRLLNEIRDQLILQADRWGKKDHYTPLRMTEMELEQARNIKGEFMSEKANLEYEMNMLGTDKREVLIKIERLDSYVKRCDRIIEQYEKRIGKMLDNLIGDKSKVKKAESKVKEKSTISVIINN